MAKQRCQMPLLGLFGLTAALAACSIATALESVPAFVWSNSEYVRASQSINYEVISTELLASRLFSGLSNAVTFAEGPLPAPFLALVDGRQPGVVVAFVGKELKTGHVAQFGEAEGEADPLHAVKAALKGAASSVVLPYISSGAAGGKQQSVGQSLVETFRQKWPAGRIALFGECQMAPVGAIILESVEEIKAFLEEEISNRVAGSTDLVLVCPGPSAASSPRGILQEESAAFQVAYSAVQEVGVDHVALYTAEPQTSSYWASSRRQTLGDEEVTTADATTLASANVTCDDVCLTKATMIEVLAVVIVLLITLISGLCCLGAVDTPTRFEAARET